ncbi:DUF4238 domain-containing protein [Pantoea sp. Lu_F5_004]|uniref:DUF4238 domain-containing protein n=1 Tax=Pantoea sp. Lu_F5_004 TaxID=3443507 RepID=UPI003EB7E3DB
MKIFEKKIRHHYVWAYYLRDWATDNKNIHYITKRGNTACDSIRGLGFEKDFYKMGMLRDEDRELITMITKECADVLKKLHWDFVEMIFNTQKFFLNLSPKVHEKLGVDLNDIMSSNLFENYLSQQEHNSITILNSLRTGDSSCLQNQETYYELCYFLGYQLARTIKMKKLLILTLKATSGPQDVVTRLKDFYERNWWFMCSFMATNLSYDMSLNKSRRVYVIENKTSIDFITSDQPVINLNPEGHNGDAVDYYYPLSPRKALIILTSNHVYFDHLNISEIDVAMLNIKMADNSCETIFGRSEGELLNNKKAFLDRSYLHFAQKYSCNNN